MHSFDAFAKNQQEKFNKGLKALFEKKVASDLRKASLYALEGGKRIRPLLTLATVATFAPRLLPKAMIPAASLELLHTYSLIHDDLPCMDNDDWRRGKKSLHRAFPEWLALLTGDFLLTHSFQIILESPLLSEKEKVSLLSTLAKRSGGLGMILGQIEDLKAEKMNWPKLKKMEEEKTAFLFMGAVEFGAIICHLSKPLTKKLVSFAGHCGLAFQLIDDLEDEEQPAKGELQKASAIRVLGYEGTKKKAKDLLLKAEDLLSSLKKVDLLLSFQKKLQDSLKNF